MSSNTPRLDQVERNLLINGNMDFWQRGTSFTFSNVQYTADRWRMANSGYTTTTTRSTDVPTLTQSNFASAFSLFVFNSTGAAPTANQLQVVSYQMEGSDYAHLHGRKFRLQFWVKSSVTGTYSLNLQNNAQNRTYTTTYSIPSANTWQKVVLDLPADTTGTWALDNTVGLYIAWWLTSGSTSQTSTLNSWNTGTGGLLAANTQTQWGATTNAAFQLAQVMLIPQDFTQAGASTVDVPFQRAGRSIGQELQMCQRYYEKSYDVDVAPGTNQTASRLNGTYTIASNTISSGQFLLSVPWKIAKRASPTTTLYSTAGTSGSFSNNADTDINAGSTIGTPGTTSGTLRSGGATGTSATQIGFYFTVDAEL